MKEVVLYTDGACSGNPGPGGFGVVLLYGEHRKELCGGYRRTTNNRMELLAVIRGLEALRGRCGVTLYSDSKYVLDALTKGWARRWRANGWRRNKRGQPAVNPDLWGRLLDLCDGHEMRLPVGEGSCRRRGERTLRRAFDGGAGAAQPGHGRRV